MQRYSLTWWWSCADVLYWCWPWMRAWPDPWHKTPSPSSGRGWRIFQHCFQGDNLRYSHTSSTLQEAQWKYWARGEIRWLSESTYQWWWFSHTRSGQGWAWEERRTQCSVCPHLQAQRNGFPGSASSVFGPWCPLVCIYTVTNNLVHKLWLFICKG